MKKLLLVFMALFMLAGSGCWAVTPEDEAADTVGVPLASGPPSNETRQWARLKAEGFWASWNQLGSCMNTAEVIWVRPNDVIVRDGHAIWMPDGVYAVANGCNSPGAGRLGTLPTGHANGVLLVNRTLRWSRGKLCTVYTHELGHLRGYGHQPDDGGFRIMQTPPPTQRNGHGPGWGWGPCDITVSGAASADAEIRYGGTNIGGWSQGTYTGDTTDPVVVRQTTQDERDNYGH